MNSIAPPPLAAGAPVDYAPAQRIDSEAQALETARALAQEFAAGAVERDRDRRLPRAEIERFSQSGLWAATVPKAYGGAEISAGALAEMTAIISEADPNLGQIPQNHFYMLEAIRLDADEAQKRHYFGLALEGKRFGNALSEIGGRYASDYQTKVLADGDGYALNGRKFYSSGALFAHYILAVANNAEGKRAIVFVPRDAPGLTLVDDWTGFGQRTTGSGTTIFENVRVDRFALIDHYKAFERPTRMGAFAQLLHAAIDLGVARAAFRDMLEFLRGPARAWVDSGVERAAQDPLAIAAVGDLSVRLSAAEALVERAALRVDEAGRAPDEESCARASIAVAEAKIATTEAGLAAANKLFELAGSRATLAELDLDRHWRNVRTHTLHDPARWKSHAIGNYRLNGVNPPRHGAI